MLVWFGVSLRGKGGGLFSFFFPPRLFICLFVSIFVCFGVLFACFMVAVCGGGVCFSCRVFVCLLLGGGGGGILVCSLVRLLLSFFRSFVFFLICLLLLLILLFLPV